VSRCPLKGAVLGFTCALLVLLVARAVPQTDVSDADLAMIYLLGSGMSGLVGGLLWPYQRSRVETLVFAIPTAVPLYVIAGAALGPSVRANLLISVLAGVFYALIDGGQHRRSRRDPCQEAPPASDGHGSPPSPR